MKRIHLMLVVLSLLTLRLVVIAEISVHLAEDVSVPVRQGCTKSCRPFWNGYATLFRYAPAFEFKTVSGAARYRFTLTGMDATNTASFIAKSPEAPLSQVWKSLVNGQWTVVCEGLDAKGGVVGKVGERTFVKTAPFEECKCEGAARPYREAAQLVYEYMTSLPAMKTLVETGVPDQNYQHNAYPSKTHAAHIKAMLDWAAFDPKNREKAMRFARASGDYLMSQLEPSDAPLAFWPPTYGRKPLKFDPKANGGKNRKAMVGNDPEGAAKYRGQVMTLYPADVGVQFIALAKVTGEKKYLEAAKGIGDTYLKIRRADGTWALKYWLATGEVECPNPLVPTKPMALFESLADATGDAKWRKVADECFAWLEKGPLTDWNWDGQFEDIEPRPPYQDLTKHNAIDTMFHLLKRRGNDPAARKLAREILRWSEDQFVFWESPCAPDAKVPRSGAKPGTFSPGKWHYPSVFEQYSCYISIDASAAKMILAYLAMYRVEKNPLDLAKSKALADAMTQVQEPSGRIPTFWAAKGDWISDSRYDWLNCMAASAAALVEMNDSAKTHGFEEVLATRSIPHFAVAVPVWPDGREKRMNDFVEFRAVFATKDREQLTLRITGSSVYRIRLNGEFVGYGPARAAKGFFRVDEWPLEAKTGINNLAIEVSAYNCNNFYIPEHSAFLQAEIIAGDACVLAATGRDFTAYNTSRVTKCSRYSYQRAFGEAYRISPDESGNELELVEQPAVNLLERIAQYPKFEMSESFKPFARTCVTSKKPEQYVQARFVDASAVKPWFKCYAETNLDVNIWRDLQNVRMRLAESSVAVSNGTISAGQGLQCDAKLDETGFIVFDVVCRKQGTLWIAFDEILSGGLVNPVRYKVGNAVRYDLVPGQYRLETFEPYTFRYVNAYTLDGEFDLGDVRVRRYRSPAADKVKFRSSDETLSKIFDAACETFAQNSVDVFTDCPSRERAGWLCDSFFLSRASALLSGSTELERLFIENYALPEKFDGIPDGMLPMCYPSDALGGQYIPNWAMWFVIQLDEYLARSGDKATVNALKQRVLKLKDFLWGYRNTDGLLENLPSWVFVEWSEANKLVQDVNYPSNATWAEMLDAIGHMYVMPELAAEAQHVRETIRRQAWTGKWFCDNAVRQPNGTLALSGKCTETCQYYMFMFSVADEKSHSLLWQTLVNDFGPRRRVTGKYPEVFFSNAFVGNFLRLELLSLAGLDRQVLEETKGYLGYMAEQTGTLWEHDGPRASCNHGFASYAANLYVRSVLGIDKIDLCNKTVTLRKTNVPLDFCEATLPIADGEIVCGWKKDGDKRVITFSAPFGWRKIESGECVLAP